MKYFSSILQFIKYNKIAICLVVVIGLSLYYMNFREGLNNKNESIKKESIIENRKFIPSKKFIGGKKGYVFKNDKNGLGYYIDN
jgi:hypothetical protein